MTDQIAVLRGPFDPAIHKETFINYLEVVLTADGTICYACPSHQKVMERIARALGVVPESCPREMWLDYDTWLMQETGCVCVWNGGYLGHPNALQMESLRMLVSEGLLEVALDG